MYTEIIEKLKESNTTLVAVSKTKSKDQILEIYNQGQRIFGENRVQELVVKKEELPDDIQWHLIGSLQSNKVKQIAPFIDLIHTVDSLKLAETINKEAAKNNRKIKVLLQVKISQEQTKHGYDKRKLLSELEANKLQSLEHVEICGVMGMASFSYNEDLVKSEFKSLKKTFLKIKELYIQNESFNIISSGMSGDHELAIEQGSTMIRIGSLLFGERD